jgi:hypothetical protein
MLMTKTAFAELLDVSRGRVSQYLKEGLPEGAGGKIHRDTALNWLARNNLGAAGERARALLRGEVAESKETDDENPADRAAYAALGCLFAFIPNIAAWAAIYAIYGEDCDIDAIPEEEFRKIFDGVFERAHARAIKAGELAATKLLGLEPRGEWPDQETCAEFGYNARPPHDRCAGRRARVRQATR